MKLNICSRPIANKYHEGCVVCSRTSKWVFFKVLENSWKELDMFFKVDCWIDAVVRLTHDAGIHVNLCIVACLVCQDQFVCELNLLRRSRTLSMFFHASLDSQMGQLQTPRV